MSDLKKPELDLDALFADAKADAVVPEALMNRIVADAKAVVAPVIEPAPELGLNLWARMLDAVGGWPSLSGLATATVAGLYIGFSDPTLLETVGLSETTEVTNDLLFGDDVYFDDVSIGEG